MRRWVPLAVTLCAASGWAQKAIDFKLGEWKVTYRVYSPSSGVCEAEPQWLYDELEQVNGLLDAFLVRGASRSGAWGDQQLPLLAEAARTLPALVESHEASLAALKGCSFSHSGLYPKLLVRGLQLVKEASAELARIPELIRFAKHRAEVERWEKQRAALQQSARETCKGKKGKVPAIYFAFQDELQTRVWMFCDGTEVRAPAGKPFEVQPAQPNDGLESAAYIQAARFHSESATSKAPQLF